MASIRVCVSDCSDGYKTNRLFIPVDNESKDTDALLSAIGKQIGTNESDFEVVYCGQKLEKGVSLATLNLTPQSTLFVFRKPSDAQLSKDAINQQAAIDMMPLVNKAVQRPNFKKTVDHILTTPDLLQKMLNAVPGLDKDPTAISMLQDPELLQLLSHNSNVYKVLKHHPLFGAAAVYVARIVNEEHARDPNRAARSNVYSLDRMSDEEDEGNQQPRGAARGPPPQQITASQVAAALAAATASAAAARPSTSGRSNAQGTAGGSGGSDFFQQSMLQAQNSALEAQLQQLRDMGITNENMARRYLTVTNGDLQAALELIFADGGGM